MTVRRTVAALLAVAFAAIGSLPATARDEDPATTAGGVWLAGDLHVHTTYSHDSYGGPGDDNTGPEEAYTAGWRVGEHFANASARGLDFLAITDHNDVRSQADPGFGAHGVIGIPGYENSLDGHAQMLGATTVLEHGDGAAAINDLADRHRANGGAFQVNHPGSADPADPDALDWSYGYDVRPDSVEVWNISRLYQPPFPSASSNDTAIAYWEGWLDRGINPAATGGSDTHWVSTAAAQGVGQPTTWVYAADRTSAAILEGIHAGRTTISAQPPALGGARLHLEADRDGDGTYEAIVGDTVAPGVPARVRVEGAPGATATIRFGGGPAPLRLAVPTADAELPFTVPAGTTWLYAEAGYPDGADQRQATCDPPLGEQTTYCRDAIAVVAMTSAMLVADRPAPAGTYVEQADGEVTLGNGLVRRTWSTAPFGTTTMVDERTGLATGPSTDLRLELAGTTITGADLSATAVDAFTTSRGGQAVRFTLTSPTLPGHISRTYTTYPGIAGFEVDTEVATPGAFTGYTLDEVALPGGTATAHAFNAGYDWRGSDTPDWEPQAAPFGGAHTGDHRVTTTAETLDAAAQWLTVDTGAQRLFQVVQRANLDSTHVAYDGTTARTHVALADDLVYLGPFEGEVHLDNPTPANVRTRTVAPGETLALETTFTGFALDSDDEAWQHFRYLRDHRWSDWRPTITFNSNGVDGNRISTGAKDDMDLAEVQRQAAVARALGAETFILDDGWQAASGDWCPDSPQCPEPRGAYPDRFPDETFTSVRDAIAGMDLGLWMSPLHFNPAANAYEENPEWACAPLGQGLAVYNTVEPDSSSNEAGLGTWNAGNDQLIAHVERSIARAITVYGARYFKFDFLVWLDCAGATDTTDAYAYREAFVAMLDRLIAAHPEVTLQVDETNDYRLFPFESVARGPSWYANGNPTPDQALHNLWVLAPYVPASTIGQSALGRLRDGHSADYLMAVALTSHLTFFNDLTTYPAEAVAAARRWSDLYAEERERFTGLVYPLLEDPLGGTTWAALQAWDPDAQTGALLAFRQRAASDTDVIALRGIRGEGSYLVREALTRETVGTFTADQLREGIAVTLDAVDQAAVWLIDPA